MYTYSQESVIKIYINHKTPTLTKTVFNRMILVNFTAHGSYLGVEFIKLTMSSIC